MKKEINVLRKFLNMSILSTDEIFDTFKTDTSGNVFEIDGNKFYYKQGSRKDGILLVAHADTVWDRRYSVDTLLKKMSTLSNDMQPKLCEDNVSFFSGSKRYGIGADDRAGVAICWLLKDSGNSILITDKEEIGAFSSRSIMSDENFRNIINSHRFMLQFDLKGKSNYKCYRAGSDDFKAMMDIRTGYDMLPNYSFTDIAILGNLICGANLSVGYRNEHTPYENLNKKEWYHTYKIAKKICNAKHQQFYVDSKFGFKTMLDEDKKLIENDGVIETFEIIGDDNGVKNDNSINLQEESTNEIGKEM